MTNQIGVIYRIDSRGKEWKFMGVTLADIKAQEENWKKGQAKLLQQKRQWMKKKKAELARPLRSLFGLNSFVDF
ncbi:hypothetical protein EXW17_15760, partial [Enterococcus faecium]|nr:hypothetical protein [Enterococcus faecium]